MKSELKILKIEQILVNQELYPRSEAHHWLVSRYMESMRLGVEFPPIVVSFSDGEYILIDGLHRLAAYKRIKTEHVQTEVYYDLTKEEIFKEAIKRNISHGIQFNQEDKVRIINRLNDFKLDIGEITKLVQLPLDKVKSSLGVSVTNELSGELYDNKNEFPYNLPKVDIDKLERDYASKEPNKYHICLKDRDYFIISSHSLVVIKKLVRKECKVFLIKQFDER